jgi:hypothetical protein
LPAVSAAVSAEAVPANVENKMITGNSRSKRPLNSESLAVLACRQLPFAIPVSTLSSKDQSAGMPPAACGQSAAGA